MKKKFNVDVIYIGLTILFFLYMFIFIIINVCFSKYNLWADVAQTGICSKIFWEAKSLHPENFFAWTESGVFSLGIIGALIYGITGSLLAAQGISPALITVLIALAAYRLFRCIGTSHRGTALGMLSIFCIPLWYEAQTMPFMSYAAYSFCVLTMFLVLADYIQLINGELKYQWIHIVFHLLLAFANGCNSSRAVLDVYAPLFVLAFVRYVLLMIKKKKLWNRAEAGCVGFTFLMTLVGYAATYLPFSSRTSAEKAFRRSPIKLVTEVLPAIGKWLGLEVQTNLFLKVIFAVLILLSIMVGGYVVYKHDAEEKQQLVIAFMWCDLLVTTVLLSVTQTDVATRYFFMAYYILTFSLVYVYEKSARKYKESKKKRVIDVALCLFLFYAVVNLCTVYVPILQSPGTPEDMENEVIVEYLEKNNYPYAYADYMDANTLTVWSDGKVQVAAVHIEDLRIYRWTTDRNWYRPYLPEDMKTAYLVKKGNLPEFQKVLQQHPDIRQVYETENRIIFAADKNYSYID